MTDKTEVSGQIKCSVNGCDLFSHTYYAECILHCEKCCQQTNEEKGMFRDKLRAYIYQKKKGTYVCISEIHFPDLDFQRISDGIQKNITLTFDKCYFYNVKFELENEVLFKHCHFWNFWNLFNYNSQGTDSVIYFSCTFEYDVEFIPTIPTMPTSDVTFDKDLSALQFHSCIFKGQLTINEAIIKKNIFAGTGSNNYPNVFGSKISFNDCTFKNNQEFYLSHNDKTDFLFNGCYFGKKLKIRSVEEGDYEKQQNNKAKLKSLKLINCNAAESDYLRIGFLEVTNFELSNLRLPQNAELNIGDCHFKNFKLTNFRNIGKFKLYKINILKNEYSHKKAINNKFRFRKPTLYQWKCERSQPPLYELFKNEYTPEEEKPNKLFQIDNTSIGKTDFQSINLSSFKEVKMFDNIFTEVDYTNVQWEREIEVGQFGTSEKTEIAKKRDTYRTLKNVMIRNNDQQEALVFYTQEMKEHRKITLKNNGLLSIDRITLAFNYWTNEFGLNWRRPVWVLIIFSIVFYGLLLYSFSDGYNSEYWQNFFEFLNPTHKTEFIAGECWGFWSYAIDFSFRIFEGLFIYQTIQAFRKYSRKL